MGSNHRQHPSDLFPGPRPGPAPAVTIQGVPPFNDTQVVSLMAAILSARDVPPVALDGSEAETERVGALRNAQAEEAVRRAIDLMSHVGYQMALGTLKANWERAVRVGTIDRKAALEAEPSAGPAEEPPPPSKLVLDA